MLGEGFFTVVSLAADLVVGVLPLVDLGHDHSLAAFFAHPVVLGTEGDSFGDECIFKTGGALEGELLNALLVLPLHLVN